MTTTLPTSRRRTAAPATTTEVEVESYVPARLSFPARLLVAGQQQAAARVLPWSSYLARLVWADLKLPGELPTLPNWPGAPREPSDRVKAAVEADEFIDGIVTFPASLLDASRTHAQAIGLRWSTYLAQLVRADLTASGVTPPPLPPPPARGRKKSDVPAKKNARRA